jgi:hypothetical protein
VLPKDTTHKTLPNRATDTPREVTRNSNSGRNSNITDLLNRGCITNKEARRWDTMLIEIVVED